MPDISDVTVKLRADLGDALAQLDRLAEVTDDAKDNLTGLGDSAADAGRSLDLAKARIEETARGLESLGLSAENAQRFAAELTSSTDDLGRVQKDLAAAMAEAAANTTQATAQTEALSSRVDQVADSTAAAVAELNSFTSTTEELAGASQTAAKGLEETKSAAEDLVPPVYSAKDALEEMVRLYVEGDIKQAEFTRGCEALTSAAEAAGTPLSDAAKGSQEFSEASKHSSEALTDEVKKVQELGEALIAFGEALAITEVLKEFGERALEAYAADEKFEISVRALTGSAEAAEAALAKLDFRHMAIELAVSEDALKSVTQRMLAFGFSTDEIKRSLTTAADAAAATGNSFEAVAQRMVNIAENGNASGRALVQLGINARALAEVMGVTAEEASKAFKALSESQRLTVLSEAMAKFGGTAQQVAQGIAGQFQNLKQQIEFMFEDVGKALAPVIGQITQLLSTTIIPFIRALAEGFAELPGPVRDTIVVLGLMAAAIVPVTLAIGGLGTAISAALTALAPLGALFTGFGAVLGGAVLAGILAAAAGFSDLNKAMAENKEKYDAIDKSFQSWLAQTVNAAAGADGIAAAQQKVNAALDAGAISAKQAAEMLAILGESMKKLVALDWKGYTEELGIAFKVTIAAASGLSVETEGLRAKMLSLREAVTQARDKLAEIEQKQREGKATTEDVAKAYDTWKSATNALKSAQESLLPVITTSGREYRTFSGTITELASVADRAAESLRMQQEKINLLGAHALTARLAYEKFVETERQGLTTHEQTVAIYDKYIEAQKKFNDAVTLAAPALDRAREAAEKQKDALADIDSNIEHLIPNLKVVTPITDDFGTALLNLGVHLEDNIENLEDFASDLKTALDPSRLNSTQLLSIWEQLSQRIAKVGKEDLPLAVRMIGEYVEAQIKAHGSSTLVNTALEDYESGIQRLAKIDLPAAIAAEQDYISKLEKVPGSQAKILEAQRQLYEWEIKDAEARNKSASEYIILLDNLEQKIKDQQDSYKNLMGNIYTDILRTWNNAWDNMSKMIADNIVEGRDWAEQWHGFLKSVEKEILEGLIKNAFGAIRSALDGVLSRITGGLLGGVPTGAVNNPFYVIALNGGFGGNSGGGGGLPIPGIGGKGGSDTAAAGAGGVGGAAGSAGSLGPAAGFAIWAYAGYLAISSAFGRGYDPQRIAELAASNYNASNGAGWNLNDPAFRANFERVFGSGGALNGIDWKPIIEEFNKLTAAVQAGKDTTKASGDQIAAAVKFLQDDIARLQGEANNLQQQIYAALASGNLALADVFTAQLSEVNRQIQTDQTYLDGIQKNTGQTAVAVGSLGAKIDSGADKIVAGTQTAAIHQADRIIADNDRIRGAVDRAGQHIANRVDAGTEVSRVPLNQVAARIQDMFPFLSAEDAKQLAALGTINATISHMSSALQLSIHTVSDHLSRVRQLAEEQLAELRIIRGRAGASGGGRPGTPGQTGNTGGGGYPIDELFGTKPTLQQAQAVWTQANADLKVLLDKQVQLQQALLIATNEGQRITIKQQMDALAPLIAAQQEWITLVQGAIEASGFKITDGIVALADTVQNSSTQSTNAVTGAVTTAGTGLTQAVTESGDGITNAVTSSGNQITQAVYNAAGINAQLSAQLNASLQQSLANLASVISAGGGGGAGGPSGGAGSGPPPPTAASIYAGLGGTAANNADVIAALQQAGLFSGWGTELNPVAGTQVQQAAMQQAISEAHAKGYSVPYNLSAGPGGATAMWFATPWGTIGWTYPTEPWRNNAWIPGFDVASWLAGSQDFIASNQASYQSVLDFAMGAASSSAPGLIPEFATGSDYVPYDMLAYVHRGEKIIPRGEAGSNTMSMGPTTINVYESRNPRETARLVVEELQRRSAKFQANN